MNDPAKAEKFKIYQDELKLRHTTHWDLDYLGAADYEAVMKGDKVLPVAPRGKPPYSAPVSRGWLKSLLERVGRR